MGGGGGVGGLVRGGPGGVGLGGGGQGGCERIIEVLCKNSKKNWGGVGLGGGMGSGWM